MQNMCNGQGDRCAFVSVYSTWNSEKNKANRKKNKWKHTNIMYTVSHTVIMCVPACLQVLKTTLDSLLGTCESQRKGDNSNVDLVTHSEAFLSFFFFWAVCTGLLSWRAHVRVSTAEEQDPAQDGPIKTCGSGEKMYLQLNICRHVHSHTDS